MDSDSIVDAAAASAAAPAPTLLEEGPSICEPGGKGIFLPLFEWENEMTDHFTRGSIYLSLLLWLFVGVAIVADVFMSAIERITSEEAKINLPTPKGVKPKAYYVRVWNPTVANLTLMALGSSAPEILLSVIELFGNRMYSGELGPSTIVGSAAFNLLMILAICVACIPSGSMRKIKDLTVYACTAFASVFAYGWLVIVLQVMTPDIITIFEGATTFLFFPILVWAAYLLDIRYFDKVGAKKHKQEVLAGAHLDVEDDDGCKLHPALVAHVVRQIKDELGEEVPTDVLSELVSARLAALQPKSRAYYRVQATRNLTKGKPVESAADGVQLSEEAQKYGAQLGMDLEGYAKTHGDGRRASQSISSARRQSQYQRMEEGIGDGGPAKNGKAKHFSPRSAENAKDGKKKGAKGAKGALESPSAKDGKKPNPAILEFNCRMYSVLESVGTVTLTVRRSGNMNCKCFVKYATKDGSAQAGEDYIAAQGELEFTVGQAEATIPITILDDNVFEQNEQFDVVLAEPRCDFYANTVEVGLNSTVAVTIIDDDYPGVFQFAEHDVSVLESKGFVVLVVERAHGSTGRVTCQYKTMDQTAVAGADYEYTEGELVFEPGEAKKTVRVRIIDDELFEKNEEFKVVLHSLTGGATFPADHNGVAQERAVSAVTILNDDAVAHNEGIASLMAVLNINHHQSKVGSQNWAGQFSEALEIEGGDTDGVSFFELVVHIISLPWKLLFATIPPTVIMGGKVTFLVALTFIGLVTAVIGDMASLFGCVIGLPDSITAITLVALGTSLPDTFASKAAAVNDATADAAVGNVTGSNAVNVFLGLGLPWLIGALYWHQKGATPEWQMRYPELYKLYPGGGFAVPAGDLVFSVSVFCGCALVCLSTLTARRVFLGAELGGPPVSKYATSLLFTALWGVYIGLSCWKTFSDLAAQKS